MGKYLEGEGARLGSFLLLTIDIMRKRGDAEQ